MVKKLIAIISTIALFVGLIVISTAIPNNKADSCEVIDILPDKNTGKQSLDEIANYYLVEASTGQVLKACGEDEKKEIASMVKIMTLLLTFEAIDRGEANLNDKVLISDYAAAQKGSELFLDAGIQYPLGDLVKGATVVSANDACVAIAEHLAGSESAFVDKMNIRAQELGMENTKFINPTGYPSDSGEQYSTAKDVNIMTRQLIKHKQYYDYSKIWVEDYKHPSGRITGLANTNKLIRFYKGCDSGKTGFTNSAKYCLSASAERNNMRVIGTVLGAPESQLRFNAMRNLFDYAFMNYKIETVIDAQNPLNIAIKVLKGKNDFAYPIAEENLVYLKTRDSKDYTLEYELSDIIAPMSKGSVVGKAKIMVDGQEYSSVNLILNEDIEKANFWDNIKKFL